MVYAHVVDGAIVEPLGGMPEIEHGPDRDWDLRDPVVRAERGWFEVVESVRPASTAELTYNSSVQLVGGVPTRVWTARPWSPEELSGQVSGTNRVSLEEKVRAAVSKDGTLKIALGTADDVAWDGITANPTLRALNRMSPAQITAVGPQRVLAKLLPLLIDMAVTERQIGKFAIDLFDEGA